MNRVMLVSDEIMKSKAISIKDSVGLWLKKWATVNVDLSVTSVPLTSISEFNGDIFSSYTNAENKEPLGIYCDSSSSFWSCLFSSVCDASGDNNAALDYIFDEIDQSFQELILSFFTENYINKNCILFEKKFNNISVSHGDCYAAFRIAISTETLILIVAIERLMDDFCVSPDLDNFSESIDSTLVELCVKLKMGEFPVDVAQDLSVGDVLVSNSKDSKPLSVNLGGREIFVGNLQKINGNKAIQLK